MKHNPPRLFETEDLPIFSGGAYGPMPDPLPVEPQEPEPAQGTQLTIDDLPVICDGVAAGVSFAIAWLDA